MKTKKSKTQQYIWIGKLVDGTVKKFQSESLKLVEACAFATQQGIVEFIDPFGTRWVETPDFWISQGQEEFNAKEMIL